MTEILSILTGILEEATEEEFEEWREKHGTAEADD